jgi:hypothetical protein
MSLRFDNPLQPVLAMPPDESVWQQYEPQSDPAVRWRLYRHQLGWAVLQPWLQEEFGQRAHLWPAENPCAVWSLVEGLALTLGSRRLLVLLSETLDAATMPVPQEWVDIPDWAADYYLAAHVDVDEQRLALWGYAPYAQVKTQGVYEPSDRTYTLGDGDLIQDFSVFWVAHQLESPQPAAIPALPTLLTTPAEGLIEQLANVAEPRLALPFEQWGALLSEAHWRRQLWQRRQGRVPVALSGWLEQVFASGWRSLDSLLPPSPALGWRSAAPRDATVSRGKSLRLSSPDCELVLVVRVTPLAGDRRRIQVQLFPMRSAVLPTGVTLTLDLPDTAEQLQTVQAGEQDTYIQLPSFRCPVGQRFRVSLQLAAARMYEEFIS